MEQEAVAGVLDGVSADRIQVTSVLPASVAVEFYIDDPPPSESHASTSKDATAQLLTVTAPVLRNVLPGFEGLQQVQV